MLKYSKIINEKTKLCSVVEGDATQEFLNTNGFIEQDVSLSDIDNNWYLTPYCKMKTDEEKAKEEAECIAHLHLTGADVERGIYKAKGMDFDDIMAFVMANPPKGLDVKALKIELKANNFYRGNPYVEAIGRMLGFTDGQLNMFFETKDYLYLTSCTLTINPTPVDATVTINDVIGNKATVPFSTTLVWSVSAEGYKSQDGRLEIGEDTEYNIVLEKEEVLDDSTTDKQPNTNADEVPKKNL